MPLKFKVCMLQVSSADSSDDSHCFACAQFRYCCQDDSEAKHYKHSHTDTKAAAIQTTLFISEAIFCCGKAELLIEHAVVLSQSSAWSRDSSIISDGVDWSSHNEGTILIQSFEGVWASPRDCMDSVPSSHRGLVRSSFGLGHSPEVTRAPQEAVRLTG